MYAPVKKVHFLDRYFLRNKLLAMTKIFVYFYVRYVIPEYGKKVYFFTTF